MAIQIQTLGSLEVRVDGERYDALLSQPVRCALFVYLAVERRVSRGRLVSVLWPESSPDRSRRALSRHLSSLRRTLGKDSLRGSGPNLALGPRVEVDVHEFEEAVEGGALDRALGLYDGAFLAAVPLLDSVPFRDWVEATRERARRLHDRARRQRLEELRRRGDTTGALSVAREWVSLEPLEDEANFRLVELLAEDGHRSDALRAYRVYGRRLARELGVEPSEDLQALVARIRGEEARTPGDAGAPPGGAPTSVGESLGADRESEPSKARGSGPRALLRFVGELTRRRVLRVATAYAVGAFVVLQVADPVFDVLLLPDWLFRLVIILVILGFPVALLLSWAFELTPEGEIVADRSGPGPGEPGVPWRWSGRRWPLVTAAAAGIVAVSVGVVVARDWPRLTRTLPILTAASSVDASRYAVFPFEGGRPDGVSDLKPQLLLHDALGRWRDVAAVDLFQVEDALARRGEDVASGDYREVALDLGAGRYVRGSLTRVPAGLRVSAAVYHALTPEDPPHEAVIVVPGDLARADSAFAILAARLLFRDDPSVDEDVLNPGTHSVAARRTYRRGMETLERWDLVAADSLFRQATRHDPAYARADLWLAQVRSWRGGGTAGWRGAAERAAASPEELNDREAALAEALLAMARGDYPSACASYRTLSERNPSDFVAWYGLGECHRRDALVLRDPASPTGWSFRASGHQAVEAYRRAFRLVPSSYRAFGDGAYRRMREIFYTESLLARHGYAPSASGGERRRFAARPLLLGDTLAFIPEPLAPSGVLPGRGRSFQQALRRQREIFHEIARAWVDAFPSSPDALEALAVSLELLGDPRAGDALRRARALATDPAQRVRLATMEVWLEVKQAVPDRIQGLRRARRLTDSVLSPPTPPDQRLLLSGLAGLTGRGHRAAALLRAAPPEELGDLINVPPALADLAGGLLAYASLGGPADSLRVLAARLDAGIRMALPSAERSMAEAQLLGWPASLAFPAVRGEAIDWAQGGGDYLLRAQAAAWEGDREQVRKILGEIRSVRSAYLPWDLSLDGLYPEAHALAAVGDTAAAIEWLDPTLETLGSAAPLAFADVPPAASLVRALALRAELAAAEGDLPGARRWARPVTILWENADSAYQPLVDQMRRLAGDP